MWYQVRIIRIPRAWLCLSPVGSPVASGGLKQEGNSDTCEIGQLRVWYSVLPSFRPEFLGSFSRRSCHLLYARFCRLCPPIMPPLLCPFLSIMPGDHATSFMPVFSIMLTKMWIMLQSCFIIFFIFYPLWSPPSKNMLKYASQRPLCDVSARQCTPCAECSCIGLSLCHRVADYQSSANAIVIAAVLVWFVFFVEEVCEAFSTGTSK